MVFVVNYKPCCVSLQNPHHIETRITYIRHCLGWVSFKAWVQGTWVQHPLNGLYFQIEI